ncbi:SDR family oxidoreductase [Ornithinimicrobium sp. INDO-MA30-4]|uniref:SDR family oxidoreductase n=1 Tax=Ornithinimicrobium sp. INDO-MA30-4 TaxID=2908651 RepID=UPI001F3A4DC2|nr:SDR family oxidoreductase [Ornithinimicrobium sp. INDO-MA30-4]UJH69856.1 sugar nucleotide-binding protein [Ornithinimicrobium sp. INDO-MA30-4]
MSGVLVLGGTQFVGKHLVEHLLALDLEVTLCNRGKSDPGAYPQLPRLVGDRDGDMSAIAGDWDTVYDVSGYTPAQLENSAQHLNPEVHYVFVSTVSVYSDLSVGGVNEESPVHQTPLGEISEDPVTAYGELKSLGEDVIRQRFANHTIIRPGIIAGADDPTDRVTYWASRFAERGAHVIPSEADNSAIQFTDVRDLGAFMAAVHGVPLRRALNIVGLPTTLGAFVDEVVATSGSGATRAEFTPAQLAELEVKPWKDLPMWLPIDEPDRAGLFAVDGSAARSLGLVNRPFAETIQAINEWVDRERMLFDPKVGLTAVREQELLAKPL